MNVTRTEKILGGCVVGLSVALAAVYLGNRAPAAPVRLTDANPKTGAAVEEVARPVDFDIPAYCQYLSSVTGGSYQLEQVCRQQEEAAKRGVLAKTLPARVANYCAHVAGVVGGSWQIMQTCILQEMQARNAVQ